MTAAEAMRRLQRAGWREVRRRGGHVLFRHPSRPGLVVVPVHPGSTLKPKTLRAILEVAGLEDGSQGVEQ